MDFDYPAALHLLDNDLPCAPERIYVQNKWFSEKQVFLRAQYNLPRTDFNAKLIPNLMNKKKYVVDFRLLKFYIQHGLILTKIHRGIKYHQRAWMAPYIAVNQEMREQAKTPFEKEVFKLMNNSVFGKTLENQKKRTAIQLVTNEQKFRQLVAKPQFMDARIYSENLCAVESQKTRLWINNPFYVGFCVLELAKLHMYRYTSIFLF